MSHLGLEQTRELLLEALEDRLGLLEPRGLFGGDAPTHQEILLEKRVSEPIAELRIVEYDRVLTVEALAARIEVVRADQAQPVIDHSELGVVEALRLPCV